MKTYDETYRRVMSRRDAYEKNKQRRNKTLKKISLSTAAALAAVLTCAVILRYFGSDPDPITNGGPAQPPSTESGLSQENAPEVYPDITTEPFSGAEPSRHAPDDGSSVSGLTEAFTSESSTENGNEGGYSGGISGDIPSDANIAYLNKAVTGEPVTDEEAAAYFAENRQWIVSSLSSSGVDATDAHIMEKGYCHMSILDGRLETRVNFRDYLVYNGSSLIAIITLSKENGELYCTPAFGAPWFNDYNAFLQAHKGEELVYVYCGMAEYVITPENRIVSPLGIEIMPEFFTSDFDYHSALNDGTNVYVP